MSSGPRVAVIGAGAWGTTLASIIAKREPVTLLCHSDATAARIRDTGRNETRLPGVDLPPTIIATADPAALADATDLLIFAAPSAHLRSMTSVVAPHLAPGADRLSVTKGLERETLQRMSQVIVESQKTTTTTLNQRAPMSCVVLRRAYVWAKRPLLP